MARHIPIGSGILSALVSSYKYLKIELCETPDDRTLVRIEPKPDAEGPGCLFAKTPFGDRPILIGSGEVYFEDGRVGVRVREGAGEDQLDFKRTVQLQSRMVDVFVLK